MRRTKAASALLAAQLEAMGYRAEHVIETAQDGARAAAHADRRAGLRAGPHGADGDAEARRARRRRAGT